MHTAVLIIKYAVLIFDKSLFLINVYHYWFYVHFDSEQWEKQRVDGKKILKCSAIPTIFSKSPLKIIESLDSNVLQPSPKRPVVKCLFTPSPAKRRVLLDHSYVYHSKQNSL